MRDIGIQKQVDKAVKPCVIGAHVKCGTIFIKYRCRPQLAANLVSVVLFLSFFVANVFSK